MKKIIAPGLAVLLACSCATAMADGSGGSHSGQAMAEKVYTPGSDASFDKRLPPVLPGEEVSDGTKKMKVWSTSGSVSVSEAPAAPVAPRPGELRQESNVGVIIDRRSGNQ